MILHAEDPAYPTEADAEILGTGTLLCLILVTPMILLAYTVEGRKAVQSTSLDCLFSFAGACLLIAAGGKNIFIVKSILFVVFRVEQTFGQICV